MKIVTYNVNGLKARIVPYKTLHAFLTALDADIICLQETKLSRQELNVDTTLAEGYEAFFSCTRTSIKGKIGYSGVATFCRIPASTCKLCTSGILPFAADEGFTGLLHLSKEGEIEGHDRIGFYGDVLNMGLAQDELLRLDREGRCVVTDHGSFVLFNIYGPCVQSEDTERMEFKMNFYKALQYRWESLLRAGRRLIIVGDLNISPFPIDSCDPGPHFNSNPDEDIAGAEDGYNLCSEQKVVLLQMFSELSMERRKMHIHAGRRHQVLKSSITELALTLFLQLVLAHIYVKMLGSLKLLGIARGLQNAQCKTAT